MYLKLIFICLVGSVLAGIPFESTPTCSDTLDIATVFYPSCGGLSCNNYNATIHQHTVWYGYTFGECNPGKRCGAECEAFQHCGSKGYSLEEYNECYLNTVGECEEILDSFIYMPLNETHITLDYYSGPDCTGAINRYETEIGDCRIIKFGCGFVSIATVRVPDCPSDEPCPIVPDSSSANSISFIF